MYKKVSLVVPVYNAADYLDRFMSGVLSQTMSQGDYEVILVDDGSTDDSGKRIDVYADSFDCVTAIHQENAGPAAARNTGLRIAEGEYVAFVDPDDTMEEKYLEVSYAQGRHNDADIVLFDAYRVQNIGDHAKREMWGHADYSFTAGDEKYKSSMQRQILYPYMAAKVGDMTFHRNVPLAAPWDKLYRRSFLLSNALEFPQQLRVLDDMCFNFRAFGAAARVTYIPTFLYDYTVVETSITNSYRADRLMQDVKVFEYLKDEINAMALDRTEARRFRQALYARIIKSFAIAMRLYFFNPANSHTDKEKLSEIRQTIDSMPYKLAFKGIHLHNLEPKLVAVVVACRLKLMGLLKVMYKLQYR
ncbi:MAG: glycosyltransferase [Butyrivibrio sp.]|nr:glycosyltransferase [Butyrivibrio sp.]MBP3197882.1 glycosyltransferase [Butyrivibrio sp.]